MSRQRLMGLAFVATIPMSSRSVSAQFGVPIIGPAPIRTDAFTDSDLDLAPFVAASNHGAWIAAWYLYPGVAFARSTDNGAAWSAPGTITTNVTNVGRVQTLSDGGDTCPTASLGRSGLAG